MDLQSLTEVVKGPWTPLNLDLIHTSSRIYEKLPSYRRLAVSLLLLSFLEQDVTGSPSVEMAKKHALTRLIVPVLRQPRSLLQERVLISSFCTPRAIDHVTPTLVANNLHEVSFDKRLSSALGKSIDRLMCENSPGFKDVLMNML